jgi:hypothetical protein
LLSRPAADENVVFHHNLYWNAAGPVDFNGLTLAQWQALPGGKGAGSLIADPLFVDPAADDFRLRPESPADTIGFEPFDYSEAGVYGDPHWKRLAATYELPPVQFADPPPPLPPLELRDDFELTPPGSEPAEAARVYHGGRGKDAFTRVVAEPGADGSRRCLKLQDAADLDQVYNPHFFYAPGHTTGVTRLAFDLKLDADAVWFMEWRDDSQPYGVGPHLSGRDGQLRAPGTAPLEIPTGQWIHVEMNAELGPDTDGRWDLVITLPSQPPVRREGLPSQRGPIKSLNWLGFCSTANGPTALYLDNIELTNSATP